MDTVDYTIRKEGTLWRFLHLVHFGDRHFAVTILSRICMPAWYFDESADRIEGEAMLLHEIEHVRQWKKEGIPFIFRYLFSKRRRREYELAAYRIQIGHLLKGGRKVVPYLWARGISTYGILSFISRDEAEEWVEELLREAEDHPGKPQPGE